MNISIKKIRKQGHLLLNSVCKRICILLEKCHIINTHAILYMDGGICSQMYVYLIGEALKRRGNAIEFDIEYFEHSGNVQYPRLGRYFELTTAFPHIELAVSAHWRNKLYRFLFRYESKDCQLPRAYQKPIYFTGWYKLSDEEWVPQFKQIFSKWFAMETKTTRRGCSVHVRRGDLSHQWCPYYGYCDTEYFINAIEYVYQKYENCVFYFYSDEPDWVKENICTRLTVTYEVVESNVNAYKDLFEIASRSVIIASQGSFGKFAALLNPNAELIIQNDVFAAEWTKRITNLHLIDIR